MTALANIELDYNWQTGADIEKVREKFPKLFDEKGEPKSSWNSGDIIVDSSEMQHLSDLGVVYKIKRFKGILPAAIGSNITDTAIVQIHLPNYVLTNFNKVCKLEDCCTYELQSHLDDGWRIIAICPPLNARRPDYILAKVV